MQNKHEARTSGRSMIGGSSLLVIFAVLCMTLLALLALNTAQAGKRLADASVEAELRYYEAEREAEAILARLRSGELPDGVTREGNLYYYTCPISDRQELVLEVEITDDRYRILRWQSASVVAWEAEEDFDLWDGELGEFE